MGNRPGVDGGRPGIDGGRPGQLPARPNTPEGRRDNLQDRLSSRDQIQNRHDQIHDDWHNHMDNVYHHHDHWHHGAWHGNAGGWWNHMWSDHTALMAFGTTMWGINRAAYAFGYWGYSNPYYYESYPVGGGEVIDYSQMMVLPEAPMEVAAEPATAAAPEEPPVPGMVDFDAARQAFYQGDYAAALASTNKALAAMPGDPIVHEFRALVLFAQANYKDAAAGLYSVLAVGPGWDWTTLSSLYPDVEVYTKQLRALEDYVKKNPKANDARFVLAYHYLTNGSKDAAVIQLKALYKEMPQDPVTKQLLVMTGGPEAIGAETPPPVEADAPEVPPVPVADLVGSWAAVGTDNNRFALELKDDGKFSWSYGQGSKSQTVKGVFAVDGNVLAMEPDSGGVMLAQVSQPQGGNFQFDLLGAPPGDPGLKFSKRR